MVRWYHAIFSAYGYWLPNDPRGSWSSFVGAWELFRFAGRATTVSDGRSYAHDPHDATLRREAKGLLKYPPVRFDELHREAIARGFGEACDASGITLHACAIGFDHVHIVAARHETKSVEQVVRVLKAKATMRSNAEHRHPLARFAGNGQPAPTPWSGGLWKVFINDVDQLRAAIAYVDRHPMKEGLPRQDWPFLLPV